jgi:2-methylisocitrate lyase-like PEP mutase family enzyme
MSDPKTRRDFLKSAAVLTTGALAAPAALPAAAPPPAPAPADTKTRRLRQLLQGQPFYSPVIENLLSARLAVQEGFPFVCISGQAPSRVLGIPDVGMVTLSDLLAVAAPIAAGVEIPVLLDLEDGKGTAMHVHRGIQLCERAGLSAVLIEDADLVPHLGAPKGDLVALDKMVDKIKAAVDARRDPDFVLLIASVGLREGRSKSEVFDRAAAYAEAGADAFWFPALPMAETKEGHAVVKKPIMSIGGTVDEMKAANVAFAAFLDFGMIALGAVRRALQEIKATGAITNATKDALPFAALRELDDTAGVRERARRFHVIGA